MPATLIDTLGPAELARPDFWRGFAPELHVADPSTVASLTAIQPPGDRADSLGRLINEEGYVQIKGMPLGAPAATLAQVVRRLDAAGLSPVFAFLYDEFWVPFYLMHPIYAALLGDGYHLLPDFWVWNVDPARKDSGWRPHRDKGRNALYPDGRPKSLTTWIALSQATPLNGCMYIVPAHQDPTYNTPDEKNWRFDYAGIRALPADAGDIFVWNQAVLHWGSRTSAHGGESRVSMAFEFQRGDVPAFNTPLLPPLQFLGFDRRLSLIVKQIMQYRHMYKIDPAIEKLASSLPTSL
jgi:Phytanoyl-CoA dioxygenase (PhyH)